MCKQCFSDSLTHTISNVYPNSSVTNPQAEAPIVKALNYQNDELSACELELENLANRLEPVLDSVLRGDDKENAGAVPVGIQVFRRIDEGARRVAAITARIRDLQSRLQI